MLVEEFDVPDDTDDEAAEAAAALERAQKALKKAETNSQTMHNLARSINRERERNHFSRAIFETMRRKET